MEITTLQDLRSHLQTAIEIEHSTIPPYLCALFSIEDQKSETAATIRGVVLEEMLHMTIACNLLNAVGGEPRLTDPAFMPAYPGPLPHHAPDPPLVIHLQRCSIDLINDVFLEIEKPATIGDIPEGDDYETLGQFYGAIIKGFETLNATIGPEKLFCGERSRQVTSVWSGKDLFPVTELKSALAAIDEIVEQGEGTPQTQYDAEGELAHYWKFNQIVDGTVPFPSSIFPIVSDPSTAKLPAGSVHELSQLFDDCYSLLLKTLAQIFNGGETQALVGAMFTLMGSVLPPTAGVLVRTQIPGQNVNAGPSFEFSATPQQEVLLRCKALLGAFPDLQAVYKALLGLPPIDGSVPDPRNRADHGFTPQRGIEVPPQTVEDTSRFGWLFPGLPAFEPPVGALIQLGRSGGPMDAGTEIPPTELSQTIPAGFTYFGQFLDHNITFDAESSLDKHDDPLATTNFRSGRIDLEHVYGLGPDTQAFEYYDQDEVGKFWIDPRAAYDVPRNHQGTALIADPRNDNTVITVQLHLQLMKFHNAVVDLLAHQVPAAELFAEARRLVVWHYQWLVLHEWLPLIVKPDVYADILKNGRKYYHWEERPYIPVEFSVASYRLHSLVLEGYRLNEKTEGTLFHFRRPFAPLPPELAIEWPYFFDFGDGRAQHAKRFEAKVVNTFLNIPGPIDNPLEWPFDIPPSGQQYLRSIAVRNLLRARAFGLPSGQEVAQRLGLEPLTQEELGLEGSGLTAAPLWYYVLKEADVHTGGVTLGDVGSRIVGEVLFGLVEGDPTSYLTLEPGWTPTLGSGGEFTMVDLLKIAESGVARPGE
ncbi:MAG TPA: ferritin-like domain-containing protein [Solirubrobacterales bacterium]|nr:ferritin-like domain-containing protein [Solirubrobacterales bacterium]